MCYTKTMRKKCNQNENNPMWKGDNVGYAALHEWVTNKKPKLLLCEECHLEPPIDLASISHIYKRDLRDWRWLCRRCHMTLDGRLDNLKQTPTTGWWQPCRYCGKKQWVIPTDWARGTGRYCSKQCSNRGRILNDSELPTRQYH